MQGEGDLCKPVRIRPAMTLHDETPERFRVGRLNSRQRC